MTGERTLGKGEAFGFEFEILRNDMGFRCGYVRVLRGHPWFEKRDYPELDVDAHGGITFADYGRDCKGHAGTDEWWIGFDTAHIGDAADPELLFPEYTWPRLNFPDVGQEEGYVWTQTDVERECVSVCQQAKAAAL